MITEQENNLLTQTGPRTPCGELMRRYWQPVALSEELPKDSAPLKVRIFGEDLVLFRDDQGRPGLLGLHCSHRGTDLSYGRVEDGGLRCVTMVGSTTFAARFSNNPVNRVEELIGMKSAISLILAKKRMESLSRTWVLESRLCCPITNSSPRRRNTERL